MMPLTASDPQVDKWKEEGKTVKLEKNGKRRTGGWARVMPDLEWFVQHLSKPAKEAGKKLFLWGFSMVRQRCSCSGAGLIFREAEKSLAS